MSGSNEPASPEKDPAVVARDLATTESSNTLKEFTCSFLAEYGEPDADLAAAQSRGMQPNDTYCADSVNPAIRPKVIIAVLPDPVHTQLAMRFDESIDELQNSMQDLGWTYDRAWLPWDNKEHEDQSEFDKRLADKLAQEGYEKNPGLVLFRPDAVRGTTQPLVVLIVGDTPTGGVNKDQFRNAIDIWKQLTGWAKYYVKSPVRRDSKADPTDAGTLQILGPTFSGSVSSLRGLLSPVIAESAGHENKDSAGHFCPYQSLDISVISGTVTQSLSFTDLNVVGLGGCPTLTVTPDSFAVDYAYQYSRLFRFIQTHASLLGSDKETTSEKTSVRVATLTEAETSFGVLSFIDDSFERRYLGTKNNSLLFSARNLQTEVCLRGERHLRFWRRTVFRAHPTPSQSWWKHEGG